MKKLLFIFQMSTVFGIMSAILITYAWAQKIDSNKSNNKLSVEIEVIENGNVKKVKKEYDLSNGENINDILKNIEELDDMDISSLGEKMEINVKREFEGDTDKNVHVNIFSPDGNFHWFGKNREGNHARLGVLLGHVPDSGDDGAVISKVIENSAADKAGLMKGDRITKVNDTDISSEKDLIKVIGSYSPGDKVSISYVRGDTEQTKEIDLGESTDENDFTLDFPDAGMRGLYFDGQDGLDDLLDKCDKHLQDMDLDFDMFSDKDHDGAFLGIAPGLEDGGEGVTIGNVIGGSAAEKMGLQSGDRILSINGEDMRDFDQISETIGSLKPDDEVNVKFNRNGKTDSLKGKLGIRPYRSNQHSRIKGQPGQHNMNQFGQTKEVNIVLEIKDCTSDDEAMLSKPANIDFKKPLPLNKIEFAPNPTDGFFRLSFELPDQKATRIQMFDRSGRMVYEQLLNNFDGKFNDRIDISQQPNGVYFLVIAQGEHQFTRKIVKQ